MSEANITIPVDLTNPGQFFACCGLLELADRLWPGAEVTGEFTRPRFQRSLFRISAKVAFSSFDLVKVIVACERTAVDPYQPVRGSDGKPVKDARKTKPVRLQHNGALGGEPFSIRLSWWLDELAGEQTRFKTWSAHNSAEGLIADLSQKAGANDMKDKNILEQRAGMTSRLGLDPRSSWNTLDTGFSPNDQKLPVDTYAATELLAAVGLETFRPAVTEDGYVYSIWTSSLPVIVARAAASGILSIQGITRYCFEVASRGRFKYFTQATLLERNNHD